jgi:hypothetical protein
MAARRIVLWITYRLAFVPAKLSDFSETTVLESPAQSKLLWDFKSHQVALHSYLVKTLMPLPAVSEWDFFLRRLCIHRI